MSALRSLKALRTSMRVPSIIRRERKAQASRYTPPARKNTVEIRAASLSGPRFEVAKTKRLPTVSGNPRIRLSAFFQGLIRYSHRVRVGFDPGHIVLSPCGPLYHSFIRLTLKYRATGLPIKVRRVAPRHLSERGSQTLATIKWMGAFISKAA